MTLLESRLDNLVFRFGFATTRRAARQLVNHKHILVNGKSINIPSYTCNVGDVITVKEASQSMVVIKAALEAQSVTVPYVEVEKEKFQGKFVRLPERSELPKDINESLIVEYYNRML
jgi:small subunit ribosomal protein S4